VPLFRFEGSEIGFACHEHHGIPSFSAPEYYSLNILPTADGEEQMEAL
jgi:hypothetical protein